MAKARDIMTKGTECAQINETVADAAKKMRDLNVGSLPVCGEDNRLKGVITDRDIVVRCIAEGGDPTSKTVKDVMSPGEVVTIGADDSLEEVIKTMGQHKVRRLPVIDGHDLVGMVAQADVARSMPDAKVGDVLQAISSD